MPYKPNQYPEFQQKPFGDVVNGNTGASTAPSIMNAQMQQKPMGTGTGGGFNAFMNSANQWKERLKPMRPAQPSQPSRVPAMPRSRPAPYNPNDPVLSQMPGAQPGNPNIPRVVGAPGSVDWSRIGGTPLQEQTKPLTVSPFQLQEKPLIGVPPQFASKGVQNQDPTGGSGVDVGTQPPGSEGPVYPPPPSPGGGDGGGTGFGGRTPSTQPPAPPPPPVTTTNPQNPFTERRPGSDIVPPTSPLSPDYKPPEGGTGGVNRPTRPGTDTPPPFTLGQAPHPFDLPGTPQGDQSYFKDIENLIRSQYQTGRSEGLRQLKHEAGLVGAQAGGGFLDSVGDFMAKSTADENAAVADKGFTGIQSARDRELADAQARMGLYGSIYGTERGAETSMAGINQQQQQGTMGYNADLARIAAQMYGIDINDRQAMMRLMWEMDPRNWMANYTGATPPGYGYIPPNN